MLLQPGNVIMYVWPHVYTVINHIMAIYILSLIIPVIQYEPSVKLFPNLRHRLALSFSVDGGSFEERGVRSM